MSEAVLDTTLVRCWKRHQEYRKSGAKWYWEVPTHWDVQRLKYLATMNPSKSEIASLPKDTEVSFLPMEKVGEDGYLDLDLKKTIEDVYQGFTYFRDGDVLVAKITPCFENGKGALAIGLENGIGFGTTEFHVLRSKGEIEPKYLELVTRLHSFRGQGISEFTGAAGQQRVPESFLNNYVAPLPPLSEQRAITAFLDRETARIDALVVKKQRLIELLEEKHKAVITHFVTIGLDPFVALKSSNCSWFPEVPKHWKILRLKDVVKLVTSGPRGWSERIEIEGSLFVQSGDLNDRMEIEFSTCKRVFVEDDAESRRAKLAEGDVVVCVTGAKTGKVAVCRSIREPAYVNQHLALIRPNDFVVPAFLGNILKSTIGQSYFDAAQYGIKQGLSLEDIREVPVVLPPIDEQLAILDSLDKTIGSIESVRSRIDVGIDRLQEYRTSLISAAVTGQIDVRKEVQLEE